VPLDEDIFRNGQFLLDLYCVLERVPDVRMIPAKTPRQALKNTEKVLRMLEEKKFLDQSFIAAAPLLANGSRFALQQLLSMVFWNVSLVESVSEDGSVQETNFVERNTLKDGVTLPKLLSAIDPDYLALGCLFAEPATESERKWNVRKSLEFLQRRSDWKGQIDPQRLYQGVKGDVEALYDGIRQCYRSKFTSLSSLACLKETLGLNPKL
jgi:hypothetical protein